ncbi:MAG: hypothetical protein N2235_03450 [Fischerella sp.]|nr:hypothetical protein [Fischerella sp.]
MFVLFIAGGDRRFLGYFSRCTGNRERGMKEKHALSLPGSNW